MRLAPLCLALLAAAAADAQACNCVARDPEESLRTSASVFEGVVESKEQSGMTKYTFAVRRGWKGEFKGQGAQPPRLVIYATAGERSCGYSFEPGKSYIVFARNEGGRLVTGYCDRTMPMAGSRRLGKETLGGAREIEKLGVPIFKSD